MQRSNFGLLLEETDGDNIIGEDDTTSVGESIQLENDADSGDPSFLLQETYNVGDFVQDKTAQNELFDQLDNNVLDFSESNPFGDVRSKCVMLGNRQFYHETIRKIIVAFGTLFNDIHIVRKNNSGVITQSMKVPLAYGPKQKFLTRLDQDADLQSKVAITLPRLGFEIQDMSYDPARKLNRVQKFKKVKSSSSDANKLDTQFMYCSI